MAEGYKTGGASEKETPSMIGRPPAEPKRPDADLLQLVRERAVVCHDSWSDNFDRAEASVDFVEGLNHWPSELIAERTDLGQPCLVLNDMPVFVDRICGEQLQNRQSIHISPGDSFGAEYEFINDQGQKRNAATVREGLVRSIEYRSNATAHYDRAHQHAVDGGFGWLRVFTRYASNRSFDQEIVISSLKNRWAAMLDTEAQEPDMCDARFGFVFSTMIKAEFERQYPKAMLGDLSTLSERHRVFWGSESRVQVAEYISREAHERELILLSNGQTGYADELKGLLTEGGTLVDETGAPVTDRNGGLVTVARRRAVVEWCVYWRKLTAFSVLEKVIKLPFSTIPLVPVLGRVRDRRDGTSLFSSAIHHAMDTKRMEEYWMSSATGRVALAPLSPWVGPLGAFEGLEHHWKTAHRTPSGYLPYNDGAEAPKRMDPPSMPIAELGLVGTMHDRTKAAIGIFDASLGAQSNETSGRAINARDRQSSTSTYVYGDNLGKAIRRIGMLCNEALPTVYDTDRKVPLMAEDGTSEWVQINAPRQNPQTGETEVVNSLAQGEFGVVVTSGPSYVTQRSEAADAQLAIMQAAPQETIPLMLDIYATNSDWPGADKLAQRARKMMPAQLLTAAEKEEMAETEGPATGPDGEPQIDPQTGQPMPGGGEQPDPAAAMQQQLLEAQSQAMMAESQAKMAEAEAKMATAEATKRKAEADMAEAELRLQALSMGGLPPKLVPVGSQPAGPQQQPSNGSGVRDV